MRKSVVILQHTELSIQEPYALEKTEEQANFLLIRLFVARMHTKKAVERIGLKFLLTYE